LPVLGVYGDVKQQSMLTQDRPLRGEISFQQLLAAAYVVQQQNERVVTHETGADYVQTLAHIAETQNLIQSSRLDLPAATMLIAEQVAKITKASGVAVGIVEGDQIVYLASRGTAADEMGLRLPLASCLSAYCLENGQLLQCSDTKADSRLRYELCRLRCVKSLIAVPVYHDGRIAGVLEVRFAEPDSFREQDARSSQLMAGLVGDAIARASGLELKLSLATERASMLEVLERIKPQLERLAEPLLVPNKKEEAVLSSDQGTEQSPSEVCRGCGRQFSGEELFCGNCGTARQEITSRGDIQSKWASLWHMQQARKQKSEELVEHQVAGSEPPQGSQLPAPQQTSDEVWDDETPTDQSAIGAEMTDCADLVLTQEPRWSWATRAPWLDTWKAQKLPGRAWVTAQWNAHRGAVYVGLAVFLLLFAIFDSRFAPPQSSNSAQSATKAAGNAKKPELTLSEKLLVSLGIAEAPPSPTYLGNPQTQVWVDLHTALYYCPGSELYGKTEGGKLTTQRDAQQDQFEPASRRACD
jgi:GAF domain-containing protein